MDITVMESAFCNATDSAAYRKTLLTKLLFKHAIDGALAFVQMRIIFIILRRPVFLSSAFYRLIVCNFLAVRSNDDFFRRVWTRNYSKFADVASDSILQLL